MSRLLVLLLVLLNGVYYAWSHQMLRAYGFAPTQQTEPQRVAQQLRPELISILSTEEARGAEAAAQSASKQAECLQAGLLDDTQAAQVRQAAQAALPSGSWVLDAATEPARWIVYMGKYPDAATLAKKRGELASLNLRFETLTNPALEFGVSLGAFETEALAQTALATLSQRGVRTASVVQERAEARGSMLKIPVLDDALRARLDELKPALGSVVLRPCV